MTAGSLSVPIMSPFLHVSILAVLLLTLNADNEESNCEAGINVRRHTVYKAFVGGLLNMSCPVSFCNDSPPAVLWYKNEETNALVNVSDGSRIKTEWKESNRSEGTSYLIFQKVLRSDSGQYQCRNGGSMSHYINLTVYDDGNLTDRTTKNYAGDSTPSKDNLWIYVYTAAGIVGFVVIVIIISVASMLGCKGKAKTQANGQYMVEPPIPLSSLQATQRGSPSAPPSQRSTRRKTPPVQLDERPSQRDNDQLYSKRNDIVYAAINHRPLAGAAARPQRLEEEGSEYAAIRIKDHKALEGH